jgi:TetR/AcrR family transcriptional regulator, tetracycline repressor protein
VAGTRSDADVGEVASRRSPGRPPVPIDRIVVTALQIVDEEGAEALSMRSLAQRLDSGTATLYRHFPNRAALIAHIIDHIFDEVDVNAEEFGATTWRQACQTVALTMFNALRRHQNVAPLLVEQVPIGPNAMALREFGIAVLLDSGFAPHLAARSYATLAHYVLGFAIQLSGHSAAKQLDDAQLSAVFRGLDPSLFPATAKVADALPVPLEDEFTFGLELILDGLSHLRVEGARAGSRCD